MSIVSTVAVQLGGSDLLPQLVGLAGTLVLLLVVVALGAFVYRSLTGGVEWPEDDDEDDLTVRRSRDEDDEWEFY
jgi:hypothetical protein